MGKVVNLKPSEFSEAFLYLNGKKFSLNDYPHMRAVYNCNEDKVVLKFSRQTAKSTTLANIMVTNSVTRPHFKSLFISPSVDQTKVFSHDRVNPVLESSPFVKKHYLNATLIQNVFMKQLLNGSRMYLRYANLNADRVRGYSADMCLFDEIQDQMEDNIPVIEETMSRSLYKRSWFSGTPKLTIGPLEDRWELSNKCEWIPKCSGCNHYNILGLDNIGSTGLICEKCGKALDARAGQWIQTGNPDAPFTGFRVCLLHFHDAPWVDWGRDVIQKMETQSKNIFLNETLALPYDSGSVPITKDELLKCCTGREWSPDLHSDSDAGTTGTAINIMGIDYGPVNSDRSYTCISIVRVVDSDRFEVMWGKRYIGKEAEFSFIHKEIPKLMEKWKCAHLCADYGMGEASNSVLREKLGVQKVIAFQHLPSQKEMLRWNSKMPAYTLNRTQVMANVFEKFRRQNIVLPKPHHTLDDLMQDILNIQIDFNPETNKMRFINKGSDDFFHATLFAILGAELQTGLTTFRQ